MPETTPLIKAALNLRVGAGFDVYHMKKDLSVILGIILTACLVACGSSNKDSVNDDKQEVRLGKMNMPEREVVESLSNGDVELKISKE